MITTRTFDLVIIGGGMVGLATACGLAQAGLNTLLIDDKNESDITDKQGLSRVSALNHASIRLLENLACWELIPSKLITNYKQMQVWDNNGIGKIQFDAKDINQPSLGVIVENQKVCAALTQLADELPKLTIMQGVTFDKLIFSQREVCLSLSNGEQICAELLIGADGAESKVRKECQIPLTFWDYGQQALVATVNTELAHDEVARQFFYDDGILAFLPLAEANLCSIVWSVSPQKAEALLTMPADEFTKALTAAANGRLGLCQLADIHSRQTFPLRMRLARHFARQRLLLLGDAAHTIHPLAGQGVNLGFIDAAAAIDCISKLHQQGLDLGEYHHLRPLERWRKADATEMIAVMEGLKQLFTGTNALKQTIRGVGLNLVDAVVPIKNHLIKQAMGLKTNQPSLCR